MTLTQNTILITGGSRGIGLALAERFVALGNTVLVTGRSEPDLRAAEARLPGLKAYRCDVANPAEVRTLVDTIQRDHPKLNVLVNNAGQMHRLDLLSPGTSPDDIGREIEVNLLAPVRLVQALLPHLRAQPRAAVINVTSGLAFVPFVPAPIYGATKAGLHSYTRALRAQLTRTSVKVYEIAAPGTDTALNDPFQGDLSGIRLMAIPTLIRAIERSLKADRLEIRPGFSKALKWVSRLIPGAVIGKV